jgi:hypothetical protein
LWAATATCASAQSAYDAGYPGGYEAGGGFVPYVDPASPQAAAYAAPYNGYEAAGWPPGAMSWPQISPFEAPPVEQNRFENGLWFNEQKIGGRRYYTMLAGTLNKFAGPQETQVGNPEAPDFFGFQAVGTTTTTTNLANGRPVWLVRDWGDIENTLRSGGFMGQIGVWNVDDSGVQLFGFWADEGTGSLDLGVDGVDINNPADILRRAEDILSNYGALPLLDDQLPLTTLPPVPPNTVGLNVPGGAQPFDLFYKLGYQSQAYGTGIGYYSTPIFERGNMKLRPQFGLRYTNLRENATFHAADSNLNYVFDLSTLRPVPSTITGLVDVVESYLRSNTKAHLGGPEAGLRLDLGTERFLIWTQSKVGVFANHSTQEIDGFGIQRIALNPLLAVPDPSVTAFHEQDTTTTVSPMFEQSIFAKAPLLAHVPLVKKMKAFESAQFQVGYTFTAIGSVYRPGDTIDWRGFPQFPSLTGNKSTWYMSSLSLGIEWLY